MNPFNFYGPQFLLFYSVLTVVVLLVVWRLRSRKELDDTPYSDTPWNDPYRIAFLRGGKNELLRVAVVSLVDRGLLSVNLGPKDGVQTTDVGLQTLARKRIERDLLQYCQVKREPKELFSASEFDVAKIEYEDELTRMRLMPDRQMLKGRGALFLPAAAVLLFFSLTKVVVALMRGRTNLVFLGLLTFVSLLFLVRVAFPRLTTRGEVLLDNVRNLFESLKVRAPQIRPGGASTELVMLAAVFGVGALPVQNFLWTRHLFERASKPSKKSGSGSSCGSSCGSSDGGGDGGGGCGGGGCGGGCGGCGGD